MADSHPSTAIPHPTHDGLKDPGALLIGLIITTFLAGMTGHQTWFYFTHFTNDGIEIKLWVLAIWSFDLITAALYSATVYFFLISHSGDPDYIAYNSRAWDAASITTGITIFLVQTFFVARIWRLRQIVYPRARINVVICITFLILAVYALASSAAMTYYDFKGTASHTPHLRNVYLSNVGIETGLDLLITVTLVHILTQHHNEFSRKKSPFEALLLLFVTRGIIVALYQILLLILPFAIHGSYIWAAFLFSLSKVYANSALMTLNNRRRSGGDSSVTPEPRATTIQFTMPDLLSGSDGELYDTHPRPPSDSDIELQDSFSRPSPGRAPQYKEPAKPRSALQADGRELDDPGGAHARKGRPWSP
ncbi:hypothetical protein FA95DRAFT_1607642 [Auriscalpium vulgare]|uniref:Uncharacterized protein n=1 Tax=Auriscalpium vulgare TaxID=40419 RepID=A0ACB8RP06_9AGAM|nr:hypothetical protein FA95DRAFT_1607642 [Auriscalpium vulgare]